MHAPLSSDVAAEYVAIAGACIARDAETASRRLARLDVALARTTLAALDPAYAPVAVLAALQMIDRDPTAPSP
jgi:hypothetical protein